MAIKLAVWGKTSIARKELKERDYKWEQSNKTWVKTFSTITEVKKEIYSLGKKYRQIYFGGFFIDESGNPIFSKENEKKIRRIKEDVYEMLRKEK